MREFVEEVEAGDGRGTDEDWALELGKKKGRAVGSVSIKRKVDKTKEEDGAEDKQKKKSSTQGKKDKAKPAKKRKRTG